MNKFNQLYENIMLDENILINNILHLYYLSESNDIIYENIMYNENYLVEGVQEFFNKLGLKIHKGKGLIDYVMSMGKNTAAFLIAAFKGDKDKMKELMKKVTKEDILHFFYQLDQATLHLVTGPLHLIDAITGWEIMANIKSISHTISTKIMNALKTLKDNVEKVIHSSETKKVYDYIKKLEQKLT